MMRARALWALAIVAIAVFGTWIARNTYWDELKVPFPGKGEALVNPFYAAQRFAEKLGARTSWDRALSATPPPNAVIVLSNWHWSIGRNRRAALEHWVESGGRLVVDNTLIDPSREFETWVGIAWTYPDRDQTAGKMPLAWACRPVHDGADVLSMCLIGTSWLDNKRSVEWALRDDAHIQAARVRIGRGSVTVVNSSPFTYRELFEGDHGRLFVAATGLRSGDDVHFLSEDDYPGLLTLMWRRGAPSVAIGLALVGFLLWRGAVRFGPLAPSPGSARRSLADQIRGSGRFALQYDSQALHAAVVRALDEAARRRITRYASLRPDARSAALARVTGFDRDALAAAVYHPQLRRAGDLHRSVALLEAARRRIMTRHAPDHGTD